MYPSTLIKKAHRLLVKQANELLKTYKLTDAYTYFLMALYIEDGLTLSELHKQIGIEQPTAVRTLDRMERDGVVQRIPSTEDRRAFHIKLTQKAEQHRQNIGHCAELLNQKALQGFTQSEINQLTEFLERITSNLGIESNMNKKRTHKKHSS